MKHLIAPRPCWIVNIVLIHSLILSLSPLCAIAERRDTRPNWRGPNGDGPLYAARAGEKSELLGENPMGERIVASPVPAANRLFIRGDSHLFCVAGE